MSRRFAEGLFVRLRVISWIESLPTADDPLNHTKNHENQKPARGPATLFKASEQPAASHLKLSGVRCPGSDASVQSINFDWAFRLRKEEPNRSRYSKHLKLSRVSACGYCSPTLTMSGLTA